ncbi:MAG: DUF4389 domain-containing protein [Chloroflexi bacterium]|nr:DUF4389 domain-containing protein [Chloroflexota bacterium]
MAYPAVFDVQRPTQQFDRGQTAVRVLLILVLYFLLNSVVDIAWWALPVFGAILISQKGAQRYLEEAEKGPVTWIRLILGFWSYASLLSDKLPLENPAEVNFKVQTGGSPSVGQALLRIILAIPHFLVLGIIGFIGAFVWFFTVITIFMNGTYPDWGYTYLRGYLRWEARVLAYLASLVDEYPPFSFSDGDSPAHATPPATAA